MSARVSGRHKKQYESATTPKRNQSQTTHRVRNTRTAAPADRTIDRKRLLARQLLPAVASLRIAGGTSVYEKEETMFSGIFQSTTIPVLQEVVSFSQTRHAVLAGNIANLDTPGYQVRDLSLDDFQQRLQTAIERSDQPPAPRSPGEPAPEKDATLAEISKNPKSILYHDKSNVGLEHQITEMVKNQLQHNMALSLMRSQFRLLQAAISGRA